MADRTKETAAVQTPEDAVKKLLSDVEAKAEDIIKAAEEKAQEIIAGAAKQTAEQKPTGQGPTKSELKDAHEKVEIELFKDNNLYRDDVYVAVNGQNIKIKRGQKVKVDKMFAEVLDNSKRQDAVAADLNEQLENEYREKSDALE